jgi:hypothetical protein
MSVAYLDSGWDRFKRCKLQRAVTPCNVTLNGHELALMWQLLFSPEADFCQRAKTLWGPGGSAEHADMFQVARWICGNVGDSTAGGLPPDYFHRRVGPARGGAPKSERPESKMMIANALGLA